MLYLCLCSIYDKSLALPDGEGASIHVLNSQLIVLGLLSQSSNTLLNVSIGHALNIPQHRDNQSLQQQNIQK